MGLAFGVSSSHTFELSSACLLLCDLYF